MHEEMRICTYFFEEKKPSLLTNDFINISKNGIYLGCSLKYLKPENSLPTFLNNKGTCKVKIRKDLFISVKDNKSETPQLGHEISIRQIFTES